MPEAMLNGNKTIVENILLKAFDSGYSNAAAALSRLTSHPAYYNNFHSGFHTLDSEYFARPEPLSHNGTHTLITTDLFGDLTGKSYLFLSEAEYELLTRCIPSGREPAANLREAFIKEMDNILSASVITRLANELCREIYGDIPLLVGKVNGKVEDIIYDDFSEQVEEIYINSTCFLLEDHPDIRPFFIWVIDCNNLKSLTKTVSKK